MFEVKVTKCVTTYVCTWSVGGRKHQKKKRTKRGQTNSFSCLSNKTKRRRRYLGNCQRGDSNKTC